nr:mycofactocin-coupled SDR family oxidoreductase [Parafrankia sp. EUN1f]
MDGKVAFITGGARGQGRSHALLLAKEGADVVVTDICEPIPQVAPYNATREDLDETRRLVDALGRRCLAIKADSRRSGEMKAAVDTAIAEFGKIDALSVNHGIGPVSLWDQMSDEFFDMVIENNLAAGWRTVKAVLPHMVEQRSGSVIFTASVAAARPQFALSAYSAAKAGLVGLMGALASEVAPHSVRVNAVLPGSTATPMLFNQDVLDAFKGGPGGTIEDVRFPSQATFLLPIPWMEPDDISQAVLFLASDESRHVTGIAMPVDGGTLAQPPGVPPTAAERLGSLAAQLDERQILAEPL